MSIKSWTVSISSPLIWRLRAFERMSWLPEMWTRRLVRALAEDYGFAAPTCRSDELLTVKANRNDLAHGQKSFSEVGRDFDLGRLEQIMKQVLDFLHELLG